MADGASPAAQGFRMPAEWEPHHATWIGWPHNASEWPGKLTPIQWVYGEIVRKLVPGEMVRILVISARCSWCAPDPGPSSPSRDSASTPGRSTPNGNATTRCRSWLRNGSDCACCGLG